MRITVDLDADVAVAVAQLQSDRGIGPSAAINELARDGIAAHRRDVHYVHTSRDLGSRLDLTSVADTLELLEELDRAR